MWNTEKHRPCWAMMPDAGHGAVDAACMTLPPSTRTSEGEVQELGLGVRNCSHSALSDPLSEKSESIERACEATSAEGTARCASRGKRGLSYPPISLGRI